MYEREGHRRRCTIVRKLRQALGGYAFLKSGEVEQRRHYIH